MACVNNVARLSNLSSLRNRADLGLINSNTSSAEDGIFHNSSQNSASSGDMSESINSVNDSRNFSRDADAPIVLGGLWLCGVGCMVVVVVVVSIRLSRRWPNRPSVALL